MNKLAVRLAAGSDHLAELVRRDQDLSSEAETLDKAIIAAVSRQGAPTPVAPPKGKICPTCGGRFDGAATFCGKDGTALVLLN